MTMLQPPPLLFLLMMMMMITPPACCLETVSMVDFCGQTIRGDGMIINSHRDSRKYYFVSTGTDCRLTMQAAAMKDKVQFQFRFFLVYSLLRNYLTLRLVTRGRQPRVDFVGDFTSFRIGFNSSACRSEPYFSCHSGKCIPSSLVCDEQNIDNCGDGSDQATGPPANCHRDSGDRKDRDRDSIGSGTPVEAGSPSAASGPGLQLPAVNLTCGDGGNQKPLVPSIVQPYGTDADRSSSAPYLYLYVILGFTVGVALLFWCCWSPGWFIWRVGACRSIPCCNSFCASCHLCTRSCALKDPIRPSKVTPEDATPTVPV